MKNVWVCLLLVLTIASQSFAAVANSKSNHQVDAQHLQTEHSHSTDDVTASNDSLKNTHMTQDCHHCGHCQGTHVQWFSTKDSTVASPELNVANQYFYITHLDKSSPEELIRPPIA